jgi:hypothetical protein
LGHSTTSTRLAAPMASAGHCVVCSAPPIRFSWVKKSAGSLSRSRPSKSLTCDSPISTAMPLVKPMTMLTGM